MKLLIIEDELHLAESIISFLKENDYICDLAPDFSTANQLVNLYEYDCLIVDITLPDGSELDIIKQLKEKQSRSGVLIISAQNALDDKLNGLDLGADDYLTKPFHLSELNARIKAIIRRRYYEGFLK